MQVETLQEGEFLFKRGQKDEWIYVIQSGKISLLALYEGKDLIWIYHAAWSMPFQWVNDVVESN